jgi:hypothetical protein
MDHETGDASPQKSEQQDTDEEINLHDRPVYSPITTVSLRPLNRRLHTTPIKMPGEDGSLHIIPVAETYIHSPKMWVDKMREKAESSRFMRLMNPVVYEARRKKTRYEQQNSQNRNAMSAAYR